MFSFKKDERGTVMVLVMLLIGALVTLGTASLFSSQNRYKNVSILKKKTESFYVAEAGIDTVVATLQDDQDYRTLTAGSLGKGSYSVTVTDSDCDTSTSSTEIKLDSTGTVQGETSEIEACVTPKGLVDYALYSGGELELKEGGVVLGDMYSEADLETKTGSTVNGNIDSAAPADDVEVNGTVTGTTSTGVSSVTAPTLPFSDYETLAKSGTTLSAGDTLVTEDGKLELDSTETLELSGTSYSFSDLYADSTPAPSWLTFNSSTDITVGKLYVPGDLELDNLTVTDSFIYVAGEVELENVTLIGSTIISVEDLEVEGAYSSSTTFSPYTSGTTTYPLFATKGEELEVEGDPEDIDDSDDTDDTGSTPSYTSITYNGLMYAQGEVEIKGEVDLTINGAVVSSGTGGMDADLEIKREDGDLDDGGADTDRGSVTINYKSDQIPAGDGVKLVSWYQVK